MILWIGRRFAAWLYDGDILLIYLMWYSAERVWLETFRVQNWIILGVPTAIWLGVITFVGAGGFLWLRHRSWLGGAGRLDQGEGSAGGGCRSRGGRCRAAGRTHDGAKRWLSAASCPM